MQYYLCASCALKFETHKAIDGYDQGFKSGFLCPRCNINIEELSTSHEPSELKYGYRFYICLGLSVLLVSRGWLYQDFGFSSLINEVLTLLSMMILLSIPFAWTNRDKRLRSEIIYTRKIHH